MTAKQLVERLQPLGHEGTKKTLIRHGAREPVLGVKIAELKKFQKQIKVDYPLSLDLFDTGIYDAMYLAGLIADDAKMTRKDLQRWAMNAYCSALSEYTVPWVTAQGPHGVQLAREWIDSKKINIATSGWTTFSGLTAIKPDDELDLTELKMLLQRVQKTIHDQPDRVRHVMNGFIISVGCYVTPLTELAVKAATSIGPVEVDMGGTACKVPSAVDYIKKVADRASIGKKRKTLKC